MTSAPGEAVRLAVLGPYAARWLLSQLAVGAFVTSATVRAHAAHLRRQGTEGLAQQVEMAWVQLQASAADHVAAFDRAHAPRSATGAISAVGNGQAEMAEVERESAQDKELSTSEVATLLGLTSRRVGQMVGDGTLCGRKVGGAWMVSRSSVEALANVRSAP